MVDQAVHDRAQPVQTRSTALGDGVGQLRPGGPHLSVGVDELVVAGSRAVTQVEESLLGSRGAVTVQEVVSIGHCSTRSPRHVGGRHYCRNIRDCPRLHSVRCAEPAGSGRAYAYCCPGGGPGG
ncbi:hypothetical protein BZL29_7481 [Mycobacterium kansasii]|uniref:Uncharacterized protein n=1 Tax=Mycobacterium kansasii TaxID=1768 RepID=A0A1V3WGE2_MYCKA|nr:hypothetical protein BZL29_7481 [Mycobacterium kansasii]